MQCPSSPSSLTFLHPPHKDESPAESLPPPLPPPPGSRAEACLPEAFPHPSATDDYFILPLGPAAPSPQSLLGLPDACSPSAGIAGGHQVRATTRSRPRRAHGDGDGVGRKGEWGGKQAELPIHPSALAGGPEPQTTLLSRRHLPLPLSSKVWNPPQRTADALGQHREDTQRLPTMVPCSHPIPSHPCQGLAPLPALPSR